MNKCINPDCDNFSAKRKPRCGNCRKRENYKCITCLAKISYRAIRCNICQKKHVREYQLDRWKKHHKPIIKSTQKILTELHNGPVSVSSLMEKYNISKYTVKNSLSRINKIHILKREFTYSLNG